MVEVKADVTGAVWKILVKVGDHVSEGDDLAILESMKMEIPVMAPSDGTVKEILAKEGDVRNEGETVIFLEV
ncbi:MAG: biotin/lipoyl-binding carrier protein [Pseudomonadota bacterium]